jgi:hypothetical protein
MLLASISTQGTQPCLAVEGATTGEVFEAYCELRLGSALRPGEVVMDNLSSHRGGRVRELIEERGCEPSTCHPTLAGPQPDRGGLRQGQGLLAESSGQET